MEYEKRVMTALLDKIREDMSSCHDVAWSVEHLVWEKAGYPGSSPQKDGYYLKVINDRSVRLALFHKDRHQYTSYLKVIRFGAYQGVIVQTFEDGNPPVTLGLVAADEKDYQWSCYIQGDDEADQPRCTYDAVGDWLVDEFIIGQVISSSYPFEREPDDS